MWFGAVHFEEATALDFDAVKQLKTCNLHIQFNKGNTNQFKQRFEMVIKVGYISGTKFIPVQLMLEYKKILLYGVSDPQKLFPKFRSKVTLDGAWNLFCH